MSSAWLVNLLLPSSSHPFQQSSMAWPTVLRFSRCPFSKVVGLTSRHSRPATPSLFGRSFSRLDNYRTEQNLLPMLLGLTFADLSPSSSARLLHIGTIGSNFLLIYRFSRVLPEDRSSLPENLQQTPVNDSSSSCIEDPPTPFGWIAFKSHQCFLTLVLSRLRPEEYVYLLENLCKKSIMTLSGSCLQEISKTLIWTYCILVPKSVWPDLSGTHSGLRLDTSCSSFKERSFPPPSSRTERYFSSSTSFSCLVEPFEPQSQIMRYAIEKLLAGRETFVSTSTKFEFIVRIVFSTASMLFRSNTTYIVLSENLQVSQKLKMRLILICFQYFFNLSLIDCNHRL